MSGDIASAQRRMRTYSLANPPMPWFGVDVGGTLAKLVFFEPTDHNEFNAGTLDGEIQRIGVIHRYLMSQKTYGETGVRDTHLQLDNVMINCRVGSLHFIHFPTCRVPAFMELVKAKGFTEVSSTVCATGGGAYKFEKLIEQQLNLQLHKFDELETMIVGIRYVVARHIHECFIWQSEQNDQDCKQLAVENTLNYPYLVVNIGSGVSILAVHGDDDFRRISGSSIGGGFFAGICALLTGCSTFSEAIELAAGGDNTKVDKLVRDIYGGDYDLFDLPGDTVAASFGQMIDPEKRAQCTPADLARATLVTVTNNIGAIALNCARSENIQRIVFVGNFLRVNPIASQRLAYAMEYWSKGKINALFLRHEGYFGAIGCMLKLTEINDRRREKERQESLEPDAIS